MISQRFDEQDRKKVISEVETHFGVSLSRVGSRRKFLEDSNHRTFWVLGGYDDWHGIPPDMIEDEEKRNSNGVLIVAKRHKNRIDVFSGSLQLLIVNKAKLAHTKKGDYQFNIHIRGNHLFVKEIAELSLAKLGEASYTNEDKVTDKKTEEIEALLNELSPEEQKEILETYANK
ncbi:MAG: hypothetical protein BMS9Abin36_0963 [Gammaproteobacteria bacterium]|nr:MAG: hypothetical protein BMS9Abin36_0963 [Gammaproteobacteria bacterium]